VKRLLIANRGEIAVRIARTARRMGLEVVAVYSDADANAPHVRDADAAYRIGESPAAASYLNIDAVMAAVRASGADAVHPGYGFLAERAEFAERCERDGITFVGPSSAAMLALGNKSAAKRLLEGTGVPFLPGYHGTGQSDDALLDAARAIGMPVMIKASSGGGGRGMRLVESEADFPAALRSARSEALAAFGDADVLLERALLAPRHVEVQIFGDAFGNVVHLGERDCSVQRRHQKLIEESPSPAVDAALRERLGATSVKIARAANYTNAGTVEYLLDADGSFYFIETNARLQVEHPVTELVTGFDLVEWQIRIARGEPIPVAQAKIHVFGHAIEARLCAEDPARDYLPQTGTLATWVPPSNVRVEHALESGMEISPYYDSMIAKLVAYADTRDESRQKLAKAVASCVALGVATNAEALVAILNDETFASGEATTRFVEERLADVSFGEAPSHEEVAFAAALEFRLAAERGRFGSWTAWSSSALPAVTLPLAFAGDEMREARVSGAGVDVCVVTVDAEEFHVEFADGGAFFEADVRFRVGGGPWRHAAFARNAGTTYVDLGGRTHAFRNVANEAVRSAAEAAGDGFLRAPMSGRIVRVGASAGDHASAGSMLVVLEAMKMEHVLSLPIDVALRSVIAVEGAQVHASDVLLEYDAIVPAATVMRNSN
jgi:geranyl-CoA carboxylase alpha subunit